MVIASPVINGFKFYRRTLSHEHLYWKCSNQECTSSGQMWFYIIHITSSWLLLVVVFLALRSPSVVISIAEYLSCSLERSWNKQISKLLYIWFPAMSTVMDSFFRNTHTIIIITVILFIWRCYFPARCNVAYFWKVKGFHSPSHWKHLPSYSQTGPVRLRPLGSTVSSLHAPFVRSSALQHLEVNSVEAQLWSPGPLFHYLFVSC